MQVQAIVRPVSFCLTLCLLSTATTAAPRFTASSMQLYYGGDEVLLDRMIENLRTGQIVVIDTRSVPARKLARLIDEANHVGAKVIGYISIGELSDLDRGRFERFREQFTKSVGTEKSAGAGGPLFLDRNQQFSSQVVDVLHRVWREFLNGEIETILDTGVHGLFLDTVDAVDLYITRRAWPIERRVRSVRAMIELVRDIKHRHRRKYILQNRGLNLIGKSVFVGDATGELTPGLTLAAAHRDNPDGVLWENAFNNDDEWTRLKQRELAEIHRRQQTTVFTLGYQQVLKDRERFAERNRAAGYVGAWATSSKHLHL